MIPRLLWAQETQTDTLHQPGFYCPAFENSADLSDMTLLDRDFILLTGTTENAGEIQLTIARITPDGQLDSTFGQQGLVRMTSAGRSVELLSAVHEMPDGRLVVLVERYHWPLAKMYVLRADGAVDPSFGSEGRVLYLRDFGIPASPDPSYWVTHSEMQPDGKMLMSGWFANAETHDDTPFLLRCLPDGRPDSTFGKNGAARFTLPFSDPSARGRTIAVMPDGIIWWYVDGGASRTYLIKFDAEGKPDPGWPVKTQKIWLESIGLGILPVAKDSLLVWVEAREARIFMPGEPGANFSRYDLYWLVANRLQKLAVPPVFPFSDSVQTGALVHRVCEDGAGNLFLHCTYKLVPGGDYIQEKQTVIRKINRSGIPDDAFGNGGMICWDLPLYKMVALRNGALLLAGPQPGYSGIYLTRLLPDGRPDPSFGVGK